MALPGTVCCHAPGTQSTGRIGTVRQQCILRHHNVSARGASMHCLALFWHYSGTKGGEKNVPYFEGFLTLRHHAQVTVPEPNRKTNIPQNQTTKGSKSLSLKILEIIFKRKEYTSRIGLLSIFSNYASVNNYEIIWKFVQVIPRDED